jgi:hypothetical protein
MNQPNAKQKPRVVVSRLILWLSLVMWLGSFGLFERYSSTRPTFPNPEQGRMYEEDDHGHYFYLTRKEHSRLMTLMIAAPVLSMVGALMDPMRWFRRRPAP